MSNSLQRSEQCASAASHDGGIPPLEEVVWGSREHLISTGLFVGLMWLPLALWMPYLWSVGLPLSIVSFGLGRWLHPELVGPLLRTTFTALVAVPVMLLVYSGTLSGALFVAFSALVGIPEAIGVSMLPAMLGFSFGRSLRMRAPGPGRRRA